MQNNNNLILAVLLSALILLGFQHFYVQPQQEAARTKTAIAKIEKTPPAIVTPPALGADRALVVTKSPRIRIESDDISGSISLRGARFDDVLLKKYHETVDNKSPMVTLLSPAGSMAPHHSYYAEFGWLAQDNAIALPNADSVWQTKDKILTPTSPLHLTWDNGRGLIFNRTISMDAQSMFTIVDTVRNQGREALQLYPFGLVSRGGHTLASEEFILHEGQVGFVGGSLQEISYETMVSDKKRVIEGDAGWLGFTDKYWLVAMIPDAGKSKDTTSVFLHDAAGGGQFQSDFRASAQTLSAGGEISYQTRFFAGAKSLAVLDRYAKEYNIPHFEDAIDFGWFYFLTKPFLHLLDWFNRLLGNFGLAILAFTVVLKLVTLPLSLKSYRSMARMKDLQPTMMALQERYKEDKQQLSLKTMELYQREGVSPLSGCWPMVIQSIVFFALYKVLYVGIEMRHAPFYGWIHDLSAPDPTSLFTAFGLLPWPVPSFLNIGIWPLLMGVSMFLTQKLSPQPPDKNQARLFSYLPIIFTFMLGHMASGLVIYWTWSNLLSILQQAYVMRKVETKNLPAK